MSLHPVDEAQRTAPADQPVVGKEVSPSAEADPFLRVPLPGALIDACRATAADHDVSLCTLFFTAFSAAVAQWRARDAVVVEAVSELRPPELADAVGTFTSVAPVRVTYRDGEEPAALLSRTAQALRVAVPAIARTDETASATFSMYEQHGQRTQAADHLARAERTVLDGTASAPVSGSVLADLAGEVRLLLAGDGRDIGADDLWTLWTLLVFWLRAVTRTRRPPVDRAPGPVDVVDAVVAVAAERGGAPAFSDEREVLSYGELVAIGEAVRRTLGEPDRASPDAASAQFIVGVYGTASSRFFACVYAAVHAGAAYVPLDAAQPLPRVRSMLDQAGCDLLIDVTGQPWAGGTISAPILTWQALLDQAEAAANPLPAPAGELAYLMFTSGSTGLPKGVEVRRASLGLLCEWATQELGLRRGTVVSQVAAVGFDASVWEAWPALTAGAHVRIVPEAVRTDPDAFVAWLTRNGVEVSFAPTPMAEILLQANWPATARLRVLGSGGDRLHPLSTAPPFRVINLYGPTECTVVCTAQWVAADGQLPPIGPVLPFGYARVVDGHGQPVPDDALGELWVGGGGVARGYRRQRRLSAARFIPDPYSPDCDIVYRTGDLVRRRIDGTLEFHGRQDRQVKLSGARIELGDLEAAALAQPGVRAAVAFAVGERGRSRVRLVLVPDRSPLPHRDREALAALVRAALPTYARTIAISYVPALPLTPNGKVDLRMLTTAGSGKEQLPVRAAARELLQVDDLDAPWFKLGGSSLDAARLVAQLAIDYGVAVPLKDLLATESVAGLFDAIAPAAAERAPQRSIAARDSAAHGRAQRSSHDTTVGLVEGLWPALERLPNRDKLSLAQRLLADVAADLNPVG